MPARQITDVMTRKHFPDYNFINDLHFEGFSNQIKIDRIVSNYLSSCNSQIFINIAKGYPWCLVIPTG